MVLEPETQISLLQQAIPWEAHRGICRRRCVSRLVKLSMDVERYCTECKAGEGMMTAMPRRRHGACVRVTQREGNPLPEELRESQAMEIGSRRQG